MSYKHTLTVTFTTHFADSGPEIAAYLEGYLLGSDLEPTVTLEFTEDEGEFYA